MDESNVAARGVRTRPDERISAQVKNLGEQIIADSKDSFQLLGLWDLRNYALATSKGWLM